VVCALLKVRPNPIGEHCSFPDIQNLGLSVLEKVDAGAVRQMVELGLKNVSRHASSANREDIRNVPGFLSG
jgi:hypothetical protein